MHIGFKLLYVAYKWTPNSKNDSVLRIAHWNHKSICCLESYVEFNMGYLILNWTSTSTLNMRLRIEPRIQNMICCLELDNELNNLYVCTNERWIQSMFVFLFVWPRTGSQGPHLNCNCTCAVGRLWVQSSIRYAIVYHCIDYYVHLDTIGLIAAPS